MYLAKGRNLFLQRHRKATMTIPVLTCSLSQSIYTDFPVAFFTDTVTSSTGKATFISPNTTRTKCCRLFQRPLLLYFNVIHINKTLTCHCRSDLGCGNRSLCTVWICVVNKVLNVSYQNDMKLIVAIICTRHDRTRLAALPKTLVSPTRPTVVYAPLIGTSISMTLGDGNTQV